MGPELTAIMTIGKMGMDIAGGMAKSDALSSQAVWLRLQARQQALQGRSNAIKYVNEGARHLKQTRINLATINARGAAGNLNPFTGSLFALSQENLSEGLLDYDAAVTNAQIARETGNLQAATTRFQANQYASAARRAKTGGYLSALGTAASAGMSMQQSGFDFGSVFGGGGGGGGFPYAQYGGSLPG